jgi:carboxypeptidase T
MKKIIPFLIAIIFSVSLFAQSEKYSRVKINANHQQIIQLLAAGLEMDMAFDKKEAYAVAELSKREIAILDNKNVSYEILVDDVQKFYQERNKNASTIINREVTDTYPIPDGWELGSMGGMYTLSQVQAELDTMLQLYPDLISNIQEIEGYTSIEGRPIQWVRISDNPNQNETEPEVLYTALHHAREGIGVQQMIFYMYYMLENYDTDPEIKNIIDHTEMYFIPAINPDGYAFNEANYPGGTGMWRKNRRDNEDGSFGVDLNRNYGYMWGINNSGSSPNPIAETYRGPEAFSEPETQAMKAFCEDHDFKIALNYHSYSNLLLAPWGYSTDPCPDHEVLMAYGAILTQDNAYTYGPGSTTIYPTNGGSDDWMYGEQDTKPLTLAYTPEVGSSSDGFWPAYSRIIPLCQENVLQNIMAAKLVGKYAELNDRSELSINQNNSYFLYDLQRLGQTQTTFTVTIEPIGDAISFIGNPNVHNGMAVLETMQDSIEFTLNPNLEPGDIIQYLLKLGNGDYTEWDTITKYFGESDAIFSEDGSNLNNWTGGWDITLENYYSPLTSITDSPDGNYPNYANNILELNTEIEINDALVAILSFWATWEIESGWDFVQVQVSTDGGTEWTALAGKYTKTGSSHQAEDEPLYDGFQSEWVKEEILLNDYIDETILIRFVMDSDANTNEDGFYFDDLKVSIINTTTGIGDQTETQKLQVFAPRPNPATGIVEFAYVIQEPVDLFIFNSTGQKLVHKKLNSNEYSILFDISNWDAGIYFYKAKNIGGKFIIR